MSKFKKIIPILIFLILPVFKTWAVDILVECDDNADGDQCDVKSGTKLFDENDLIPGQTVTRSIQVINYDHNDDCNLKMFTKNEIADPSDLPQKLFTFLKRNGSVFYGIDDGSGNAASDENLQNIFDSSYLDFGKVTKAGGSVTYEWIVTLDTNMNNDYQGASTIFDFSTNFVCSHDEGDGGDDEGGGEGGETAGVTTTAFFAPFFGGPTVVTEVEEEVAGVTTKEPPTEVVEGVSVCKDPWWIWLLFVAQFLIHLIISKIIGKKERRRIFHILVGIVSAVIFYLTFCQKWYVLISLGITLFRFLIDRNKD